MNNNPFETIAYLLTERDLTVDEKRRMKAELVAYATTHPVKSGLFSPYFFRSMSIAFASLAIVLGGSIGVTAASARALPNQSLYPLKIWVEELRAKNQKTPVDVVDFETTRIETRFHEASVLALNHALDDANSKIIQAGIEHSRATIKNVSKDMQITNPALALQTVSNLETTFSSNSKILATIEKNTHQNIGTIVLAAQVATKSISLEKTQFEQVVAAQPNDTSKITAETKLAALKARIGPVTPVVPEPVVTPDRAVTATTTSPLLRSSMTQSSAGQAQGEVSLVKTSPSDFVVSPLLLGEGSAPAATPEPLKPTVPELVIKAEAAIATGNYSDALVLIAQAEQILDEATLTKTLEEKLDLEVSVDVKATTR